MRSAIAASRIIISCTTPPRDYKSDGRFRSLEVASRVADYRTTHRQGYIAD